MACAPLRNSPFSDALLGGESELNASALRKISSIESDGKTRIAIFSDSHHSYKDLDQTVVQINELEAVDFVVNLGDVTNSGYNVEYDQFLEAYDTLRWPSFSVIGNHDAIGAGVEIFKAVFGSSNFWFESESRRFIFFHSANLEDPKGFDSSWLKQAVGSSAKKVIVFSHVPLRDQERFQGADAENLASVIENPKTQIVFNGHNHVYQQQRDHDTLLIQCPRVENLQWLLIEINGNQVQIQLKNFGDPVWESLKN